MLSGNYWNLQDWLVQFLGIADSLVHARLTGYAIPLRLRAYAITPNAFRLTQHMCTAGFAIIVIEMQSTYHLQSLEQMFCTTVTWRKVFFCSLASVKIIVRVFQTGFQHQTRYIQ